MATSSPSNEEIDIMKVQSFPPLKRIVNDSGYVHTFPLMELFQMRIDKFDDTERWGELYGKIDVVDLEGGQTLYNRLREKSEHIHANSTISLTGPLRSISLATGAAVNIELYLCGEMGDDRALFKWQFSFDCFKPQFSYICRGKFLMEFCDKPNEWPNETECKPLEVGNDKPLMATFEGPNGCCLTMYYTLLDRAVQAWVKVEVIDVNKVPNVVEFSARGSIFAKYGHFEHKNENDSSIVDYCRTPLLKTSDVGSVKVERWKAIELSRWIVAVPGYSSLVIEADLWDTCSNLKFGQGKVEFVPSESGFGVDYIKGDHDFALRVMVSWYFGALAPQNFPF